MAAAAGNPPVVPRPRIQELPKDVVDRIAAGEVVQRPSSVIKELLENSLDADSTTVRVHLENGGLTKMVVSDNGNGIAKADMPLAATRFATSKLRTVDDLQSIESFGFRGEALASVSLVARLGIVSRKRQTPRAFKMEYRDGKPNGTMRPIAGKEGTSVTVQDLFYNIPHRKKMKERDEYQHVLHVVQRYAIQYASRGVGMVCSKKTRGSDTVDLNTSTLTCVQKLAQQRRKGNDAVINESDTDATRQVIAHVFGAHTEQHLLRLQCEQAATPLRENVDRADANSDQQFQFKAQGFITKPSYEPTTRGVFELILFVNDRLVTSTALKRCIEGVYTEFTISSKPFIYLSVTVPGNQVDVNVHPTKREVALLHQDDLFEALAKEIHSLLENSDQTFAKSKSLLPKGNKEESGKKRAAANPPSTQPTKRKALNPARLVRTTTAAPAGALEPFLTPRSSQEEEGDDTDSTPESNEKQTASPSDNEVVHFPSCEMYNTKSLDMSVPGAFAMAPICRCQVDQDRVMIRTRRTVTLVRPKRVVPTTCNYKSIQSLRSLVAKRADKDLAREMRDSTLVGVMSKRHSLVQCGEQLLLWNHHDMAKELFYQLALAQFGGMEQAVLGGGVNVLAVMEQALEFEEQLGLNSEPPDPRKLLQVSETNNELAQQATSCLMDNADMLNEYFSICFERKDEEVVLTGLPILLEEHSPQPHGLPLFLIRLATEVDWTEERPCFEGVCRELGSYYAEIPAARHADYIGNSQQDDTSGNVGICDIEDSRNRKLVDPEMETFVKHSLFPALCFLLVPPKDFKKNETVSKLALLSSLYKVFERC